MSDIERRLSTHAKLAPKHGGEDSTGVGADGRLLKGNSGTIGSARIKPGSASAVVGAAGRSGDVSDRVIHRESTRPEDEAWSNGVSLGAFALPDLCRVEVPFAAVSAAWAFLNNCFAVST